MTVEIRCTCERTRQWHLRVTGGDLAGAHESLYACADCAPLHVAEFRKTWRDVVVADLPGIYRCPICKRVTRGVGDVANRYCPGCRAFTERCVIGACTAPSSIETR